MAELGEELRRERVRRNLPLKMWSKCCTLKQPI